MSVSEQIIEVLEYLCSKVGLVIDWSSAKLNDDLIPYFKDLTARYTQFKAIDHGIGAGVGLLLTVIAIVFIIRIIHCYRLCDSGKMKDSFWANHYGMTDQGMIFAAIFGILLVIGLTLLFINLYYMIKWICVPDIQMLETIQNYLSKN